MKRMIVMLSAFFVVFSLSFTPVMAEEFSTNEDYKQVELTKKQKKELQKIHKKLYEAKKEMIEKHVEYGILSEEKGKEMIEKLDEYYEMIRETGYVPMGHGHRKKCACESKEEL